MTGGNSLSRLCFIDQVQIAICKFDNSIFDDFIGSKSFKLELSTGIRTCRHVQGGMKSIHSLWSLVNDFFLHPVGCSDEPSNSLETLQGPCFGALHNDSPPSGERKNISISTVDHFAVNKEIFRNIHAVFQCPNKRCPREGVTYMVLSQDHEIICKTNFKE